ncbi:WAS/WASL-interacting protein family member 1-like [Selaginella moellendorffii]|uniref:WAS/WASL-interacting protein family member 1-like n=1 Tax=Selaginella moellendorffii TaxID=88036 RepID=UPI000D1C7E99|nr:WAS/WASL-interacting protein family member 1-like [Selaginella moellendorffii]|eukprot:XP_024523596.1 WAS/WASL-interacting protein family member 1-like [Selaginella moellendorffii]
MAHPSGLVGLISGRAVRDIGHVIRLSFPGPGSAWRATRRRHDQRPPPLPLLGGPLRGGPSPIGGDISAGVLALPPGEGGAEHGPVSGGGGFEAGLSIGQKRGSTRRGRHGREGPGRAAPPIRPRPVRERIWAGLVGRERKERADPPLVGRSQKPQIDDDATIDRHLLPPSPFPHTHQPASSWYTPNQKPEGPPSSAPLLAAWPGAPPLSAPPSTRVDAGVFFQQPAAEGTCPQPVTARGWIEVVSASPVLPTEGVGCARGVGPGSGCWAKEGRPSPCATETRKHTRSKPAARSSPHKPPAAGEATPIPTRRCHPEAESCLLVCGAGCRPGALARLGVKQGAAPPTCWREEREGNREGQGGGAGSGRAIIPSSQSHVRRPWSPECGESWPEWPAPWQNRRRLQLMWMMPVIGPSYHPTARGTPESSYLLRGALTLLAWVG